MILSTNATDLIRDQNTLARWPAGKITVAAGQLVGVRCAILPRRPSVARVWWETRRRSTASDRCVLYYHSPLFSRFLVLDFITSGRRTRLSTFFGACLVLDEIARIKQSVAIFAHLSTEAISDRLLLRLGWQQHMPQAAGRHWVKRFYDGYPSASPSRLQALGCHKSLLPPHSADAHRFHDLSNR